MKNIAAGLCATLLLAACSSTPTQPAPISERTVGQPESRPAVSTAPTPAPAAVAVSKPLKPEGEIATTSTTTATTAAAVTSPRPAVPAGGKAAGATYTVQRGDTLYKIAREQGVSAKDLAAWNNLVNMDDVKAGQVLRLAPEGAAVPATASTVDVKTYPKAVRQPYSPAAEASIASVAGSGVATKQQTVTASSVTAVTPAATGATPVPAANASKTAEKAASAAGSATDSVIDWGWPTAGKVSRGFTEERKGVDIAGKMGQSVVASAGGKVVYAGSGLRGYGKMVIVQHGSGYLSTYAHNSKLLVKEGDVVKKGEKIAEMGNTDADETKLHFEIRRFGKPVDPTKYISAE